MDAKHKSPHRIKPRNQQVSIKQRESYANIEGSLRGASFRDPQATLQCCCEYFLPHVSKGLKSLGNLLGGQCRGGYCFPTTDGLEGEPNGRSLCKWLLDFFKGVTP